MGHGVLDISSSPLITVEGNDDSLKDIINLDSRSPQIINS